jgi:hypothetical protein
VHRWKSLAMSIGLLLPLPSRPDGLQYCHHAGGPCAYKSWPPRRAHTRGQRVVSQPGMCMVWYSGGRPLLLSDHFFSLNNTVVLFLSLLSSVGSCNWARLVTSAEDTGVSKITRDAKKAVWCTNIHAKKRASGVGVAGFCACLSP